MGGAGGAAWRAVGVGLAAAVVASGCALFRAPAPAPIEDGIQVGVASWYGPGFHGRRTASGEIYDQDGLTAAHPSLPFGTRVRVTNLDNGRAVDVRITDRGPFVGGRVIDLSRAAARVIGLIGPGVGRVRIEVAAPVAVARAEPAATPRLPPPPEVPARVYLVEVAVLRDPGLAARLRDVLAGRFPDAQVAAARVPGDGRYCVRLGPFREENEARAHAEHVTRLGYPAALVEAAR
jgi:peptidoglycan lytic transglycosylase